MSETTSITTAPNVSIDPLDSVEEIATAHQKLQAYVARAREMTAAFEKDCIEWIKANERDIEYTVDDKGHKMRMYLGHPSSTKSENVRETVRQLEIHSGGDLDAVQSCFSSSAIKPGAAKKILPPEVWAQCFKVTVRDKLETGEVAPKELQQFNDTFVR